MNRSDLPRELRPFVDEAGRLTRWPTRMKVQRMAAALLAIRFEPGRDYSEKQVNAMLMDGHTFADWALLRRVLCDWMFLDRESDGSRYWLRPDADPRITEHLGAATAGPGRIAKPGAVGSRIGRSAASRE